MGMATTTKLWTVAEVQALPEDGRRYEVIDGVLYVNGIEVPGGDLEAFADIVTPAPSWRHGDAVEALYLRLHSYLRSVRVGAVRLAPRDVALGETIVQPDLFVVPLVNDRPPRGWEEAGYLLLAVEVLSLSTARQDRILKRRLYQRAGVPEYWIVDMDARLIERWRPEDDRAEHLIERLEWRPDAAVPPFELDLEAYFAEVAGD
jgi:Uma2 family endonuclease